MTEDKKQCNRNKKTQYRYTQYERPANPVSRSRLTTDAELPVSQRLSGLSEIT